MSKNLLICDLLALYGPLLTDKQSHMLELYYFEDFSLSEIAENEGGSRQGAMDVIKRAEKELLYIEEKLGLLKRNKVQSDIVLSLKKAAMENDIAKITDLTLKLEQTLED